MGFNRPGRSDPSDVDRCGVHVVVAGIQVERAGGRRPRTARYLPDRPLCAMDVSGYRGFDSRRFHCGRRARALERCMSEAAVAAPDLPVMHPCPADPDCRYCADRPPPDAPDWSFLDAVYCISLKSRDDRMHEVSAEFHRVGLCQRVTFY